MTVDEITDTTAQLSWKEGADNHSPVTSYSVQARTPFSVGWQTAATGSGRRTPLAPISGCRVAAETRRLTSLTCSFVVPEVIDGKTHTATIVKLNPWVEHEFRVVASNGIGGGEPSLPSEKVRTGEAG